jgi:AcrR family transcriptional regulator
MLGNMSEVRRSGRWRTGQLSKARIIEAARDSFMRDGYDRATVRRIAADAGVDVAMVYYFFGNKEGLTRARRRSAAGWCAGSSSTGMRAGSSSHC